MIRHLAALIIVASALCAWPASAQGVALQIDKTSKQAAQPQAQANPQSVPIAPAEPTERAGYQADCSNPVDHDAADWCQQERAADAATRAAEAAERALGVARDQSVLLWITLTVTAAALWAAFRAANAAHRTFEGLERPYVFVTEHDVGGEVRGEYPPGGRRADFVVTSRWIRARLYVRNLGRSPCTLRSFEVSWRQAPDIGPATHGKLPVIENHVLRLEAEDAHYISTDINAHWTQEGWLAWVAKKEALFVFVAITYEDVLGNTYVKRLCFRQDTQTKPATEYGGSKYNYEIRVRRDFFSRARAFVWGRFIRFVRPMKPPSMIDEPPKGTYSP